jgi:hypothetical protein
MLPMLMTLWLALSAKPTRRALPRRRPACRRPLLEALEDRLCPSTLTVTNALDNGPGSLRDTITKAQSGDTIVFAPSLDGQSITLTSDQLTINNSLNIQGPGAGLLTISGNNTNRIFNINEGFNVTINGLTLTQGRAVGGDGPTGAGGGGAILNGGSVVSLANDVFSDNVSLGASGDNGAKGGAIANSKTGLLMVSNSTFVNNRADGSVKGGLFAAGGAISSEHNAPGVTVIDCTFTGNQAIGGNGGKLATGAFSVGSTDGGAIIVEGPSSILTVIDSIFTGNEAIAGSGGTAPTSNTGAYLLDVSSGGAIACGQVAPLVVSGSTFTDNEAIGGSNASGSSTPLGVIGSGFGGAIYPQGDATVTDSRFSGNEAIGGSGDSFTGSGGTVLVGGGYGGAIYKDDFHNSLVSWSVGNCAFANNQAIGGTGNTGGILTGDGIGGAILTINYGQGVTGTVSGSTFTGNQAIGGGGSVGSNAADGLGGALANLMGSTLTVSGCTLSGNQAIGGAGGSGASGGNGFGGGVYSDGTSTLTLTGSTVTANRATSGAGGAGGSTGQGVGGGAYFAAGGTVCLDAFTLASIVGNTATSSNPDMFGSVTIC